MVKSLGTADYVTNISQIQFLDMIKRHIGTPLVNHQKYTLKFKEDPYGQVTTDVSVGDLTHMDVTIKFAANYVFRNTLSINPYSMTFDHKQRTLLIGSYGLPGGAPNELIKLIRLGKSNGEASGYFEQAIELMQRDRSLINTVDEMGTTALIVACQGKVPVKVARRLIELGANVNYIDRLFTSPILSACSYNLIEHAKLLLLNGVDLNLQYSRSPIGIAIEHGNLEMVTLLLLYGAQLDQTDKYRASISTSEIQQLLSSRGISLAPFKTQNQAQNNTNVTPTPKPVPAVVSMIQTPIAVPQIQAPIVIQRSLTDEPINELRQLIFERATYKELALWITKYPNHINTPNKNGETPLHLAAKENLPNFIKDLIRLGADINPRKGQHSPLALSCHLGYLENVKILITSRANVNWRDKANISILESTIARVGQGHAEGSMEAVVKELIRGGATVSGNSAFVLALENDHLPIIRLLVDNGAQITNIFDREHQRTVEALQYAIDNCCGDTVYYLIGKGAKYLKCDYEEFNKFNDEYQDLLISKKALNPNVLRQIAEYQADQSKINGISNSR